MTTLLPLLALALVLLGIVLGRPPEAQERPPISRAIAALIVFLIAAYAAARFADGGTNRAITAGLGAGMLLTLAAAYLPKNVGSEPAYLALGAAGPATLLWLAPDQIRLSGLGLMVGYGFAALTLSDEAATLTAVGGSFVSAATVMGRYGSDSPAYTHVAVALALGISLLGICKLGLLKVAPKLVIPATVGVRILALGLAYSIGSRYLGLSVAWVSLALALAAGVAVWAALPSEETLEPGRAALATVLWIGLGTLTFGLARGFGMSLALLMAGGLHLVLGERRALISTGPLLGLVLYRIFREAHLDASRALDIGQHYALIGLALGAVVPILPERWWATRPKNEWLQSIGGVLWCGFWGALPTLAALLLGPKGVVGMVVGFGFSTLFTIVSEGSSLLPLATAAGAGGLAALTFGWLTGLTDMARDDKLHWLLVGAGPLAIVAIILALLGAKRPQKALKTAGAR